MGNPAPIEESLFDARVIMMIMRVLMVMSLCQVVTGWVPILKCLLLGVRECLWLCPIMPDSRWRCFPRTWLQWLYTVLKRPPGVIAGGPGACRAESQGAIADRQVVKLCLSMATEMGERTGMDQACVYFLLGWWSLPSARSGRTILSHPKNLNLGM
jgi:hypothetical protein